MDNYSINPDTSEFSITLSQHTAATPGQPSKEPYVIPVSVGVLSAETRDGELGATEIVPSNVLLLTEPQQTFTLPSSASSSQHIIPSVLRGFSAPVNLSFNTPQTDSDLSFLSRFDTDAYNRWAAAQEVFKRKLCNAYTDQLTDTDVGDLLDVWSTIFKDNSLDDEFKAFTLMLPSASVMSSRISAANGCFDPLRFAQAGDRMEKILACAMEEDIKQLYTQLEPSLSLPYSFSDSAAVGTRSMRRLALNLLAADRQDSTKAAAVAVQATAQLNNANNMTDRLGAFSVLCGSPDTQARAAAIDKFHQSANKDALVLDTWFRTQAAFTRREDLVTNVMPELAMHDDFDQLNPNKVRALVGGLMSNVHAFHRADGSGYEFVGRQVLSLAPVNPQLGSQLTRAAFAQWQMYDTVRQEHMQQQLTNIAEDPSISTDVLEVANRILGVELS